MRASLLLALVVTAAVQALAQAHAGCPVRPPTLAAMRGCYRPLLLFSRDGADARLIRQRAILDAAAADMMERDILLIPLLARPGAYQVPRDAARLQPGEADALRKRFKVATGAFEIVLLGEDGGAKLTSPSPVTMEQLNSLIDGMPTRQREMQQPHRN